MNKEPIAFSFEQIPLNADKSSVKVFKNTNELFSLEYMIFEPKTVRIYMYSVERRWLRKNNSDRGLATIRQFASALGLHPDFHKITSFPIHNVLRNLNSSFQIDPKDRNSLTYYCGGVSVVEGRSKKTITLTESIIDDILEILTEEPRFAYIQFIFRSVDLPKECLPKENEKFSLKSQVHFDIQQGKVERRVNPIFANVFEETGCYEFSPRIILVESCQENLKDKLERLAVLFGSKGLKTNLFPSITKRFSTLKKMCKNMKIVSPILLDGYSLINFIVPPQKQFSHDGYFLVPNKSSYSLSSGISSAPSNRIINIGTPIISGKTTDTPLLLDGKDLSRHMAVFGMTGEGKSRFVYGLIKEFHEKNITFLIFDPKGEYLAPILSFCDNFIYLKPGSTSFPWGINFFQVPRNNRGENIIPKEDHIQFVVSLFDHFFEDEVSPQMHRLLHQAVIRTIKDHGNFRTFLSWVNRPKDLNVKGAYLENSAAGIVNRIEKLFFGNTGRCFTVKQTTLEVLELLNHNVIIDLSAFETMEDQKGRKILLDIIFQFLYYYIRSSRPPFKEGELPKNVFILDEIQKLILSTNNRRMSPMSMIGRGPWTLRAYDVSMIFVGTDPIVDQPMLTNTGLKAIFFTNFDSYQIASLLGISKLDYEQLRSLLKVKQDERRCIISLNGKTFLIRTNDFSFNSQAYSEPLHLPLQEQLQDSYQKFVFNPSKELFHD